MASLRLTAEDLSCNGIAPIGPVCPWPKPETWPVENTKKQVPQFKAIKHDTVVKASAAKMASGLLKNVGYLASNGKVNSEIRQERYDICLECPHFIEDSKRCSECGCFMEAKTWIAAEPSLLCPKNKWPR